METMRLDQVCSKGRSSLRQKDVTNDGPYMVYGASGVVGGMSTYQNELPYVAVVKDGAGVGRARICEAKTSVVGTMQSLLPNERISCGYLLHLVRFMKLGDGFIGSTIPHIYFRDYGRLDIPVPSRSEQGAIVSSLDAVEQLVQTQERLVEKLDDLVKSRFVEMFGDCPEQTQLGKVCCFQSGRTLPKEKELSSGEYLYAKVGDLSLPGNETVIRVSRTYVDAETANECFIPKGAVVFPKRGGAIGTNKKRITGESCCLDLNLMSVIPGEKLCTAYLLAWFNQLDLAEIANGSAIPQINNKDLDGLVIPLPEMKEQQEFASFVRQVDKLKFAARRDAEQARCANALEMAIRPSYSQGWDHGVLIAFPRTPRGSS